MKTLLFLKSINPFEFYKRSRDYAYSELRKKQFYKQLPFAYFRYCKGMFLWYYFNKA